MSEVAEIVREGFARWGSESLFDLFDPDIEWEVRPDLPDATTYRGHEGVRELYGRFMEVMDDMWFSPEEIIDAGEGQVVVLLRWGGRGKGSGAEFEERRETWILQVRNRKVTRVKEFATRQEALAAAGLSER